MVFFSKSAPEQFSLQLDTSLEPSELSAQLREHEPWGHRIDFSNGVSTQDLARHTPFSQTTIKNITKVARSIPFDELRGGSVLDVGCSSGYNSIFLAREYAMRPTGIDVNRRHIGACALLSSVAGVDGRYLVANAETFSEPESFDVVVHFATLCELPNPLVCLKTSYANLKKGGYLALETQVYDHPRDKSICYFMHHNDHSKFWALSEQVLERYLKIVGFREVRSISKGASRTLGRHMSRLLLVAQK